MNRPIVIKLNPIQSVYKQRGLELSASLHCITHGGGTESSKHSKNCIVQMQKGIPKVEIKFALKKLQNISLQNC